MYSSVCGSTMSEMNSASSVQFTFATCASVTISEISLAN